MGVLERDPQWDHLLDPLRAILMNGRSADFHLSLFFPMHRSVGTGLSVRPRKSNKLKIMYKNIPVKTKINKEDL